jgi:hypothetical protein
MTTQATTTEATTTAPPPVTVTETQPAEPVPATTAATTAEPAPTTVAAEPTASESGMPWGWIVLGVALAALGAVAIAVWARRRARAAAWSNELEDLTRRSLVALDDVLAQGSVVAGRVEALAAEARSLERRASGGRASAEAARVRAGLDELARALAADRSLRLASPPPSEEQVSYSTALIRQQVAQLQGLLRPPA